MNRFKNILVLVNVESNQDAALERASQLAKQNKADLTIVTCVDELPARLVPATWNPQEVVQQEQAKRLEHQADLIRDQGVAVWTRVLSGSTAVVITREVVSHGYDLVMKTAQGKSEGRRRLFGSVAHQLMRICPCPVWVVQPRHQHPYQVIMAAVDPCNDDGETAGLNNKILELAVSLSESGARELHIVHAFDPVAALASMAHVTPERVESVEQTAREEAKRKLARCLLPWSSAISQDHIHLVSGPADAAIRQLAVKRDVDIIVMGTVARTGLARFFIGNTAERVLNQVTCSVLAVKPDGFVSPVQRQS